jgi:hypothetical protein
MFFRAIRILRWFLPALGLATLVLTTASATASNKDDPFLLGDVNSIDLTTTLEGTTGGSQLYVENASTTAQAFALYGLLSPTAPGANSAAVRGRDNGTGASGIGVWGSQAGSGFGIYGTAPLGRGVYGLSSSGTGVWGSTIFGVGVLGEHTATTGTSPAVSASTNSIATGAVGVLGRVTSSSPGSSSAAVRGQNNGIGAAGIGVWGSQAGSGFGVFGSAPSGRGVDGRSTTGTGVFGEHTGVTGTSPAVRGETASTDASATAVYGRVTSTSPGLYSKAVAGINDDTAGNGIGVYGSQNGYGWGVFGTSLQGVGVAGTSTNGEGVDGEHTGTTTFPGVYGATTSTAENASGVFGLVRSSSAGFHTAGVAGWNNSTNPTAIGTRGDAPSGTGVAGFSTSGTGVFGQSSSGYAGVFYGPISTTGGCVGCSGPALQIDDPLDPAHKYLQHSTVASPDMLDVYSGNVTTDAKGFAVVQLPSYFQALNRSFRYQLTSLSGLQEVAVAKEIANNQFTIQSQKPHARVSWQVSGIRHDPDANAHPIRAVVPKSAAEQGKYLHPELYGKPRRDATGYQKPPGLPLMHSRK